MSFNCIVCTIVFCEKFILYKKRNIFLKVAGTSMLELMDFITFSCLGSLIGASIVAALLCSISLIRFMENHK